MSVRLYTRGVLLIEVLVAIAIFAIIGAIATEVLLVSMRSTKDSSVKDASVRISETSLESVRATSEGDWYRLYNAPRNTPLHTEFEGGEWVIKEGVGQKTVGTETYVHFFMVSSSSRNLSSRSIDANFDSGAVDPSTLGVTAYTVVPSGATTTLSETMFRWRNIVCTQTDWSGGSVATYGTSTCESIKTYTEWSINPPAGGTLNTSSSSLKLAPLP